MDAKLGYINEYVQFVNLLQKVGCSRRIQLLMRKDNYSSLYQLPFPHKLEPFFVDCIQMSTNSKVYDLFDIPNYIHRSACRFKPILNLASNQNWSNRLVRGLKVIFLVLTMAALYYGRKQSHAMMPISNPPNISISRDELDLIGKAGSYSELQKYQRSQRAKLSASLQRAHNMQKKPGR